MRVLRVIGRGFGGWALLAAVFMGFAAPVGAAPPSPDTAVTAFLQARAWLDAGQVPAVAPDPPGVAAAGASLRLNGRLLGTGRALAADPAVGRYPADGPAPKPDPRGTIARAVASAISAVYLDTPVKEHEGLTARLALELEVATEPEPLIGRTFAEITKGFEPAEAGLAMRHGDRWGYLPASQMITRRLASKASGPFLAMLAELMLPARDLAELQDAGSTAVYAVRGIRLVQADPRATPFVPARTLPVRSGDELSRAEAATLAGAIVGRLADSLRLPAEGDGVTPDMIATLKRIGLRGGYQVMSDAWEPSYGGPAEQALCVLALAKASDVPNWPEPLRLQARATACAVLRALADVGAGEVDPAKDHAAAALGLLAIDALRGCTGEGGAPCEADLEPRLAAAATERLGEAELTVERPYVAAALVAAAAVRERAGMPLIPRAALEQALAEQWKRTEAAQLVTNGPLLLIAERALAADDAALTARLAPRRAAIDAALTVLLGTQQRPLPADAPATLADGLGAFPVTGTPAGRASSQSARAQLFVALGATLPGADSTRAPSYARALRGGSRFLAQLTAGPEIRAFAPNPAAAQGGVLASTVDLVQPLVAQAMAVWALAESERAQDALDRPR